MTRFLRLLGTLLVLGGAAGFYIGWQRTQTSQFFCAAAERPAAYEGQWFYRLHQGPDGWLFRDDDLTRTFSVSPQTLRYLERLNERLATQGVTLVLAAQPPRGLALPAGSLPGYDPDAARAAYSDLQQRLMARGLHVTDLAAVVSTTPHYFFRRDHHWTPEGAEASARAVAETLGGTSAYQQVASRRQTFDTQQVREEAQVGSYGEAVGRICGENPPAERLTRTVTEPTHVGGGTLFGEAPAPPITLVGTSNSARKDLNFAGFLEEATGLEVLNASAVGGGPEAALEAFLRSKTFRESPPTFLVWEFATLFDLPQNPVFYRQLLPSLEGACSVQASRANVVAPVATRSVLFDEVPDDEVPGDKVPDSRAPNGSAGFLYLEFSDLAIKTFDLELSYQNAPPETLTLRRSSREANDGRFFLELRGRLAGTTLLATDGARGDVQARVCP